jgi:hypothetical protein
MASSPVSTEQRSAPVPLGPRHAGKKKPLHHQHHVEPSGHVESVIFPCLPIFYYLYFSSYEVLIILSIKTSLRKKIQLM